ADLTTCTQPPPSAPLFPYTTLFRSRWLNRHAAMEIEEVELPVVSPRLTWSPNRTKLLEIWHSYYEKGCYEDPYECKTHGMKSTGNPKDSFDWKLSPCERVERILKDHADGEDAGE